MMDSIGTLEHLIAVAILAQGEAPQGGQGSTTPQGWIILLGGAFLIMLVVQTFFGRSDAKEKAKRDQMISALKKNDPVVTIGGILGQVVSVSEDKQEVTIRVDDNARLKVQATAIRQVVRKESKDGGKDQDKKGE